MGASLAWSDCSSRPALQTASNKLTHCGKTPLVADQQPNLPAELTKQSKLPLAQSGFLIKTVSFQQFIMCCFGDE